VFRYAEQSALYLAGVLLVEGFNAVEAFGLQPREHGLEVLHRAYTRQRMSKERKAPGLVDEVNDLTGAGRKMRRGIQDSLTVCLGIVGAVSTE
jgi:HAMP domain-containing protein